MKAEGSTSTMDDGTKYYANGCIIGIDPYLELSEGYDGSLSNFDADPDRGEIPAEHRKEIAAYMIALWTRVLNGEPRQERTAE